jgi:hypothetical protein
MPIEGKHMFLSLSHMSKESSVARKGTDGDRADSNIPWTFFAGRYSGPIQPPYVT